MSLLDDERQATLDGLEAVAISLAVRRKEIKGGWDYINALPPETRLSYAFLAELAAGQICAFAAARGMTPEQYFDLICQDRYDLFDQLKSR